jgi:2,3-bisphosphoglycerate-dependent phosphoglycerate mutase
VDGETIYLVRHGETRWNVEGRIQGQLDSDLTERGIEQARAIGRLLSRHVGRDLAFAMESSPSGRALSTARLVAEALGFDPTAIRTTPLLAERHMGDWAGMTLDDVDQVFPAENARRTIDDPAHAPAGGESFDALFARAHAWLGNDRQAPVTIAVTHGLIGRTIRGAYLGHASDLVVAGSHPQDRAFRLHAGTIEELLA